MPFHFLHNPRLNRIPGPCDNPVEAAVNDSAIIDELLVLGCQRGDAAAFNRLVERWHDRLVRYARWLTGDVEMARDAVQEAWMAVISGVRGLDHPALFPAWAFRIVKYKCVDRRRRNRRDEEAKARWSEGRGASGTDEEPMRFSDLNEAIASLPAAQRDAVLLFYYEGFSVREIALIESVPAGTVKTRLYHARKALRGLLEEDSHE